MFFGVIRQLDLGLPADALGLADSPLALERGEYLALYDAGSRTVEDVAGMDPGRLSSMLGPRRAQQVAEGLEERADAA